MRRPNERNHVARAIGNDGKQVRDVTSQNAHVEHFGVAYSRKLTSKDCNTTVVAGQLDLS